MSPARLVGDKIMQIHPSESSEAITYVADAEE